MPRPLAEHIPDRPRRRAQHGAMRHDYGLRHDAKRWRGPVERRDPASYQAPSRTLVRCSNRWCGHWRPSDAAPGTRCPHCYEPLPSHA